MGIKDTLEKVVSHDMSELWNLLSADDKRLVVDNFVITNYRKNELIYAESENPDYLRVLLKGRVKMYKSGIGERVQILRMFRPVQYFGYRAYFAGEDYVSACSAFEPSVVGALPMNLVEDIIKRNNAVAMFFIHELSRNLGGSDTKIVNLTQKHLRGRLAEALLLLADNYGLENDGATLRFCSSREDLANLSNMTASNATRTLTGFVADHLIAVDGRRITLLDEPTLRKISRHG